MTGIRIFLKNKATDIVNSYEIKDIVFPIKKSLCNMYWILEEPIFKYNSNDEFYLDDLEVFDKTILQYFPDESYRILLCEKNFLIKYSEFIVSDNNKIYGFYKKINLFDVIDKNKYIVREDFISSQVEIYFSCIDALFWDIYCKNKAIIDIIKDNFSLSETLTIGTRN